MDDEMFTLAVETTAQVEVLRAAMVTLVARLLAGQVSGQVAAERQDALDAFVDGLSARPPEASLRTRGAERLLDAAARRVPLHAVTFAADVRRAMPLDRTAHEG